ncbi:DNA-directed RNA polymerases I and III subunit RPAC2-like isoform X2 [Mya arenaria]|uniref:DNA-directed RNA polymerases I and III subunit RPAC2-like isoform X2 n=1 Tax=Mya arenaria TaxID=6604 RepID=UPI0022E31677|nr:DNA-directed RNA polymerases I and III subunit RPAC2-like isoform X2 [Mya arenaria]
MTGVSNEGKGSANDKNDGCGEKETRKLAVMPTLGSEEDDTCVTFVINKEDHTLGNSLRYMVMKNPDTQFCGYSIPHPSEEKINFRIQTRGTPAKDVLKKGMKDLNSVCEHVLRTFETSINEHKRRNQSADIEPMDQSAG